MPRFTKTQEIKDYISPLREIFFSNSNFKYEKKDKEFKHRQEFENAMEYLKKFVLKEEKDEPGVKGPAAKLYDIIVAINEIQQKMHNMEYAFGFEEASKEYDKYVVLLEKIIPDDSVLGDADKKDPSKMLTNFLEKYGYGEMDHHRMQVIEGLCTEGKNLALIEGNERRKEKIALFTLQRKQADDMEKSYRKDLKEFVKLCDRAQLDPANIEREEDVIKNQMNDVAKRINILSDKEKREAEIAKITERQKKLKNRVEPITEEIKNTNAFLNQFKEMEKELEERKDELDVYHGNIGSYTIAMLDSQRLLEATRKNIKEIEENNQKYENAVLEKTNLLKDKKTRKAFQEYDALVDRRNNLTSAFAILSEMAKDKVNIHSLRSLGKNVSDEGAVWLAKYEEAKKLIIKSFATKENDKSVKNFFESYEKDKSLPIPESLMQEYAIKHAMQMKNLQEAITLMVFENKEALEKYDNLNNVIFQNMGVHVEYEANCKAQETYENQVKDYQKQIDDQKASMYEYTSKVLKTLQIDSKYTKDYQPSYEELKTHLAERTQELKKKVANLNNDDYKADLERIKKYDIDKEKLNSKISKQLTQLENRLNALELKQKVVAAVKLRRDGLTDRLAQFSGIRCRLDKDFRHMNGKNQYEKLRDNFVNLAEHLHDKDKQPIKKSDSFEKFEESLYIVANNIGKDISHLDKIKMLQDAYKAAKNYVDEKGKQFRLRIFSSEQRYARIRSARETMNSIKAALKLTEKLPENEVKLTEFFSKSHPSIAGKKLEVFEKHATLVRMKLEDSKDIQKGKKVCIGVEEGEYKELNKTHNNILNELGQKKNEPGPSKSV